MMKISSFLLLAGALVLTVSCEKPQTDAEKSAQVEREVQQRLAAEHQTADQQRLAQQQADLDAREKALATKESATETTTETTEETVAPRATPRVRSSSRVSSVDSSTPSSYDTFYRKLEPYGAWRETADYGYVWQPREAQRSRDWRPYTDGRWAYTDAGWTWVSDEPFGWATYHYGRWSRLSGVGWVWVPGEEWAPAWVSWRKGDKNVGWAPLPPEARFEHNKGIHKWADSYYDIDADEYVFIPNEEIGAENVQRSVIPANRNVTIVEETTNVTNLSYNNTTIVNEGPSFDELRGRSRRPLERMRIEREYDVEREQRPQASISGEVIQMVTPLFTARATERPRTEGPRLQQTTVERHWAGGANNADSERARSKMRSEATPPPDAPAKRAEKPVVVAETAPSPSAPVTTATPNSAAPSASPVASPEPRHSPATVMPASPTPAPVATATAVPTAKPTSTPVPTMTATPTPKPPTPTATPVATATMTPMPTASPIPTARPVSTPAPTVAATAEPTVAPKPAATPLPVAKPPGLATPTPEASDGNPQDTAAAARAEQMRKREELRGARGRDTIRSLPPVPAPVPPAPAIVPPAKAVTPPPSTTPDTASTLPATRPKVAAAQRGRPAATAAPSATTTPPPAAAAPIAPVPATTKPVPPDEAAAAATPPAEAAKPVVRPGRRLPPGAAPQPTATPSAANEP